jgi:hypothetical protein
LFLRSPAYFEETPMTTPRLALLIALTSLIAAQARAQKAPTPPSEDIRCLIVAMQFAASNEADQKTGANVLAMYYMGRLDNYPARAIEDAITKELPALNTELFKSDAVRCGKALMEKGQILTLIGTNLNQRAKLQQAPSSAPAKPQSETKP